MTQKTDTTKPNHFESWTDPASETVWVVRECDDEGCVVLARYKDWQDDDADPLEEIHLPASAVRRIAYELGGAIEESEIDDDTAD